MDRAHHWQQTYENNESSKLGWYEARSTLSLTLIEKHVPYISEHLIDVGGGDSSLVDSLLDAGYLDVSVLDISSAALEETKARLAERSGVVTFLVGDVLEWKPSKIYKVWHDRAVFHFMIDETHQAAYLKAMHDATDAGSIIIIATYALDGPETCSNLPVQRYSAEQLAALLGDEYAMIDKFTTVHVTPWNSEQNYIYAVFRRL